jgi:hypothetical protein
MATYVEIASVTVGSGGAANIEFTSIPSIYTDLVIKFSGRFSGASNYTDNRLYFNSSTSGYSERLLYGTGSSAGSASNALGYLTWGGGVVNGASSTANTFSNHEIYIPNYAGSQSKSVSTDSVTENNSADVFTMFDAGLWANSAAITSIKMQPDSGSYVQYSNAYLYGIKKD